MDEFEIDVPLKRNLLTRQKHRREVLWQITVPLVVGVLILLTMAVLTGFATTNQASHFADISMMWLITPTYLCGLIGLLILAGLIYLIVRLILVLPFYTYRLHTFLILFGLRIKQVGDKAVEPILRAQAFTSSIRQLGRNLRRR